MELKLKQRKTNSNKQKVLFCIVALVLLFVGIGYAYLRAELNFNLNLKIPEVLKMKTQILGQDMYAYVDNYGYVNDIEGGLYVKRDTIEDENPVFYYKGSHTIAKNNVLFANKCWKIVRTTETGGTKLLYNGLPNEGKCDYAENGGMNVYIPTTDATTFLGAFNTSSDSPAYVGYMYSASAANYHPYEKDLSSSGTIETSTIGESDYINIINDENYPFTYDSSTKSWTSNANIKEAYESGTIQFNVAEAGEYYLTYDVSSMQDYEVVTVFVDNLIKGQVSGEDFGNLYLGEITTSSKIKIVYSRNIGTSSNSDNFIFSIKKIAEGAEDNRWVYGNSVTYSNGVYTLQNTKKMIPKEDISNYHYTCFTTSDSCADVNYVYHNYFNSYSVSYINLSNGMTIEKLLKEELFPNNNARNAVSSTIKNYIDKWFSETDGMMNYLDYLEDTVWCNDRTIDTLAGWNPNGGNIIFNSLTFKPTIHNITLACANKYDRFTLKTSKKNNNPELDGNQMLDYPVGLLTLDETNLVYSADSSYESNNSEYWLLSPANFIANSGVGYIFSSSIWYGNATTYEAGIRPSVSLKKGTTAIRGTGTADDPYVVTEYTPKVTLTYMDGAEQYGEQEKYEVGNNATIRSDILTKSGWFFHGWDISAAAETVVYPPGSVMMILGNTTLYAVWEKIFNFYWMNGYTDTPIKEESGTLDYIEQIEEHKPLNPTRAGYTFLGWSEPTLKEDGDYYIYAQWKEL